MNNRLKLLLAPLAAIVACGVASNWAHATPITGEVDMSGTATLDKTTLGTATKATAFTSVSVGGLPTGAFVGTFGDAVTWNPFGWNPSTTPVNPLWKYTDAGTGYTYTFDLATVSVATQNNKFLNLTGTGTISITGTGSPYSDTSGDWSFTISNPNGAAHANFAFTFANSQVFAGVPDGGTTLLLLGAALSGIGLIRRKLAA